MPVHPMLAVPPGELVAADPALAEAIAALLDGAAACTACADACLAAPQVAELVRCIRLNLDCADLCGAAARLLSRTVGTEAEVVAGLLRVCVELCRRCGDECEHGARTMNMAHCRVCMEACRRCQLACRAALAALPG